jgi:hypothetical protein
VTTTETQILRAQVADKIAVLLPLTEIAPGWEATFQREAARWQTIANGRPAMSDARSEALDWSLAHKFVLEEAGA